MVRYRQNCKCIVRQIRSGWILEVLIRENFEVPCPLGIKHHFIVFLPNIIVILYGKCLKKVKFGHSNIKIGICAHKKVFSWAQIPIFTN